MHVIDFHAHPPRKGIKFIDNSEYVPPKNQNDIISSMIRDAEEVIQTMNSVRTDKKVLMAMPPDIEHQFHYGETDKETGLTTLTSHEWIARVKEKYPERFLGIACLNPTKKESIKELEKLVGKYDFRGVKIHQAHYNFMVNDKRIYPFYEKCIELDIPVAFHTGYSPVRDIDRLIPTMPLLLDELAYDLPELKIVMCHVGGNWYQEGVLVALRNENILVDIAGIHLISRTMVCPRIEPDELLRRIIEILDADRILYGTDNMDRDMNIDYLESLGVEKDLISKIAGENAERLLKIR